ncbi:MAG: NUDIX domain-containing protein [Faecalibacterium sp.]|nr:NUDIX domain-containing protein [Faecalibacterium sp.]
MPEFFDVVTEYGQPTGQTVERTLAHAQGIRHRTAHVWLLRSRAGRVQILLQKRSYNKDSFPGCWDISSAGHIPAGVDFVPSALRELQEELGVAARPDQLLYCGQRRFQYRGSFHGSTFVDDQVSNVYILWLDKEPQQFTLQPEEVAEVCWFNFEECVQAVAQNTIPHCIYTEELELLRQGMQTPPLTAQLQAYAQKGLYPLHMPGHKRRLAPAPGLPFDWDLTEVPGVDDLHDAEEILADSMQRTAALYGAKRSWHLVGGSTAGLLAGIRALAPVGSTVIAARNCHKAVYHAIELGGLTVRWLAPPINEVFGVYGSVSPEAVGQALRSCPQAKCVILTSPTYEGVISDIHGIAFVCHLYGVPLLVDEAHGAHLIRWAPYNFPAGAVECGADLVVQSAHKTLPSLTQTAWLHLNGDLVDPDAVARQLQIFQTSSPSYPLLASLDGAAHLLATRGEELYKNWTVALAAFDRAAARLQHLRVLCHGGESPADHPDETVFAHDPSKLLVNGRAAGLTGAQLAELLRSRFGFETEMACGENLLAMTAPADDPAALCRFAEALLTIDRECIVAADAAAAAVLPPLPPVHCTIAAALAAPAETVAESGALGRVAAEYVWAYPPGVPLIAPGEQITAEFLAAVAALQALGTRLHHTGAKNGGYRCVAG